MFEFIKYLINRRFFKKAFHYLDTGKYIKSIEIFKFLKFEKKMNNFYVDLNLGRAYLGTGELDKAKELFLSSYDQFPVNPVPLNGIGVCYLKKKNYIYAYKFFKKALKVDSIHPVSNYYIGICLIAMGHKERSGYYFQKVLSEKKEFLFSRIAMYIESDMKLGAGIDLGEF